MGASPTGIAAPPPLTYVGRVLARTDARALSRFGPAVLIGAISVFLIARTLSFVGTYAVNVPFIDQWVQPIDLLSELDKGKLSFHDLWAQNGENRMVFPKLLILGLARLTNYDVVAEVYTFVATLIVVLALLLVGVRKTFGTIPFLAAVIPFLVFYPRQWENFMPGIQITVLAITLPAALVVLLLLSWLPGARRWPLLFGGALVAATLCSYSAAGALVVWPAGAIILVLQRAPRKWMLFGIWIATAAAEAALYRLGLNPHAAPNQPGVSYVWHHPTASLDYAMTLLGAALIGKGHTTALVCGIVLVVSAVVAVALVAWNRALGRAAFWIGMTAFSLGTAALILAGRGWEGTGGAFSSRYTTATLPTVLGTLMLFGYVSARGHSARLLARVGLAVLLGWIVFGLTHAFDDARTRASAERELRNRIAFGVLTARSEPDGIITTGFYPDPAPNADLIRGVRTLTPVLARHHYSVFEPDERARLLPPSFRTLKPLPARSTCALESANGVATGNSRVVAIPNSDVLELHGWCVDRAAHGSAGGVYLDVDGRRYPARYHIDRPDLAAALGSGSYRSSGFERFIAFPPRMALQLALRREHTVSVIAVAHDGHHYYEPLPFKLRLSG
jgi:hypothetical protein